MADIYASVGSSVRNERKRRGLTLRSLAASAHTTPAFIGQIERGERKLSLATLQKIALAFGLPSSRLLSDDYPKAKLAERDRIVALLDRLSARKQRLLLKVLDAFIRDEEPKRSRRRPKC